MDFLAEFLTKLSKHLWRWKLTSIELFWHPVQLVEPFKICLKLALTMDIFLKVEKILKGSLDSIPSPSYSVKIQIMGKNVLPYYVKKTFPPIIWIFTEGECDGIESRLSSWIFSTLLSKVVPKMVKTKNRFITIVWLIFEFASYFATIFWQFWDHLLEAYFAKR